MREFDKITKGEFDNIQEIMKLFPNSVEDVKNRVGFCKDIAKQGLKVILNIAPEDRDFVNTVKAFDLVESQFNVGSNSFEIFELVCPDNEIRNACHEAALELNKFAVEVFYNKQIYDSFKEYLENQGKAEVLNSEEKFFIEESIKDFKRSGFDLPEDEFLKVKKISQEISGLGLKFDKNINTDNSFIEVGEKDLTGLDEEFINSLQKNEQGKIILKCDYPTYFNVMQNCSNEKVREKFYLLFQNRAYPENVDILNSIINKRDELAKMLGFESYSELDLHSQMVKTPEKAELFLKDLAEKAKIKMGKEFDDFTKDLPDSVTLNDEDKMKPWDYNFVKNSYKKKYFDIDERKISEYFPVDNTLKEIFNIYQEFLSLRFEFIDMDGLWHKDVKIIKVYSRKDNKFKGILFLDLYPRDNKYSHACMADLVPKVKTNKRDVPAVIMVIGNFPKATKNKPALLKHNDVEVFFHEFGHAMHGLLGETELASFSGTNVKRDFVEMPSQMFEEWLWDKDILKKISFHYKTGENLPNDIIERKIKLKKLTSGFFITRQCWLSLAALKFFDSGKNKNTNLILNNLHEKYMSRLGYEKNTHFQAAFGHLVGYGAKYYGYMWSKVFALDLFYKVKDEGLLDADVGLRFIESVLSKGGSVDPNILIRDFLGREPNQEAFLKDLGIS